MTLYNDGYWGKCSGCEADGFWEETEEVGIIRCECGHEESI